MEDCPRGFACMHGLEPMAVQEVADLLLGRRLQRRPTDPIIEALRRTSPKPRPKLRRSRRRQVSTVLAD
jgi:hypothetical protein